MHTLLMLQEGSNKLLDELPPKVIYTGWFSAILLLKKEMPVSSRQFKIMELVTWRIWMAKEHRKGNCSPEGVRRRLHT
jgi:hypothetical protein